MKKLIRSSNSIKSSRVINPRFRRNIFASDDEAKDGGADNAAQFQKIVDDLQKAGSYKSFISSLSALAGDTQKRDLFMKYFGEIESFKPSVSEGTSIAVADLIPTQSEIDWQHSLKFGLTQDCSYFFNSPVTVGSPVLTYAGKYIIDGHHRWSQAYMFNPEGTIVCDDFNYDADGPIDVLKDFQAAVVAIRGEVVQGKAGTNIWSVSADTLRKHIDENIQDVCWQSLVKVGVAEDRESAIEYLVGNAMRLKGDVSPAPGAPEREWMPQTTKEVVDQAKEALTEMSASTDLICL